MFGIFKKDKSGQGGMSAAAIMGMLGALGVNIDELMKKAEGALLEWFLQQETVCGHKLTAVCNLDQSGTHFILSLWKKMPDGTLSLWQSIPLTQIIDLVKNNMNGDINAESAVTDQLPGAIAGYTGYEQPAEQPATAAAEQPAGQPATE